MPDITMCPSDSCSIRKQCLRNPASGTNPGDMRQSWFTKPPGNDQTCGFKLVYPALPHELTKDELKALLEQAYLSGFMASSQGWNGEHPLTSEAYVEDEAWIEKRNSAVEALINQ
jgi:hypothetical protein